MEEQNEQKMYSKNKGAMWLLVGRILLGATFVVAAFLKLTAPVEEFEAAIRTYEILPTEALVGFVALVLPWIEIALGTLLIIGAFTRIVLLGHAALLALFIFLIIQGLLRGLDIDCGCFGSFQSSPAETLIRDIILLALAGVLLMKLPLKWSVDGWRIESE